MSRPIPYLFCRYNIFVDESPQSAREEWNILTKVRGVPIAYRVSDPKPDDKDTYLMKPRTKQILGHTVHTWEIAQNLKYRERSKYDHINDEISDDMVETDEIKHTKIISLPSLGVFAVNDRISERSLGAKSAVSRFRAIIETLVVDSEINVTFAGTPQDAQRALETWTLAEFSFTVRPFNPHPRKMGEKLHELMKSDDIGSLRAVALPVEGKPMQDSHAGLISEAKGLTEEGYGQYGASGTTPNGLSASLSKPKFTFDRDKNLKAQSENRTLKVYIEGSETHLGEESAIVKALLDLYGD